MRVVVETHWCGCYLNTMTDPDQSPVGEQSLKRLRVFPLPDAVLFPGTVLPLHIFEPRYREMVADALATDRILAIAMLKPGYESHDDPRPPFHPVVGVGRISQVQKLKDGRFYLALHGVCRARVLAELPPDRPFRLVEAEAMPDEVTTDKEALSSAVTTLHASLVRLLSRMPDRAETLSGVLEDLGSPGLLADVLCAAALENAHARQDALATTNVLTRLQLATGAVAELMLRNTEDQPDEDMLPM